MPRTRHILILLLVMLFAGGDIVAQSADDKWSSLAPDTDVIVTLRTGERYTGKFLEATPTHIIVTIGKVDTRLSRLDIRTLVALRPTIERYREMRAMIDDEDVDRLLILVDWLRTEQLFTEALTELGHILEVEPGNADALRLQSLTQQQKDLADDQFERSTAPERSNTHSRQVVPSNSPPPGTFPVLSEEQVNIIKVYEVDLEDPPKLLIERETIQALVARYGGTADIPSTEALASNFFRRKPAEILNSMFEARARDLYGQVHVLDLPESLKQFRDNVNSTWLVNTCGTTTCHGGLDAGDFMLFNRAQNNERAAITNLLILERFRTSSGASLLNYESPENALLLHYALPLKNSSDPHPQVRGFRPAFRSEKSRRYMQAIQWMQSMHNPRPNYPVEFSPPTPADFEREPASPDSPATEPSDR
jgi:hypothetical protein